MDRIGETRRDPAIPRRWRWGLIALCWLVWGLFYATQLRLEVPNIDWRLALTYALPDAVLWIPLTPIPVALCRRFPLRRGAWLRHGLLHLAAAVAVALTHTALDTLVNLLRVDSSSFGQLFNKLLYYGFQIKILLYLTLVGIAHYFARVESLREERRRASELRAQLSEARLEALRLQLRPHFLFNVLNTISGLMEDDPETSRRVVRRLGELLRMGLDDRGTREIPLRRELELTRAYLDIEEVRFQDRLRTRIEAPDETLDCAVPPFILQPIVENAMRWGMRPEAGTRVKVKAAVNDGHLELRVVDDGPGLRPETGGRGIGLANTRARLAELYGDEGELRLEPGPGGGVAATVILPYSVARAESLGGGAPGAGSERIQETYA